MGFDIITPVDGSTYAHREHASNKDIDGVLAKAKMAQENWRSTSIEERARICTKAVDWFKKNQLELSLELTWLMGRPAQHTPFEIQNGFVERAEYMIDIAEMSLSRSDLMNEFDFRKYVKREPLGSVLVLAPWNYPYLTSVNVIIPALMAGNTVILKHAEQTALCAERYAEAFKAAGLPDGVFQFVHASHNQIANIIADSRIDYVAFTGSVEGGKAIQQAVGDRFISTGLELGGKDPAYVCGDANLNQTIENLVDGSYFNAGQSCCGIERIYVQKEVYDEFVDGFVELTKQYLVGNPTEPNVTLGPLVRKRNAQNVQNQIAAAVKAGAKDVIDPTHFGIFEHPYLAPQILIDVDHSMSVMQEETFGPVVGIMQVDNENEAINLMNDSQYGLTASIWTSDQERAISVGNRVNTGTWFMNRCDYLDPSLAWTGIKNSGNGCTLSSLGYDSLTRPKSFHLKNI
ncbi:MAG: aldehyde dehydrogenase family protein [Cyclobacteriaceae bacterium]